MTVELLKEWHCCHDNLTTLARHLIDEEGYDAEQMLRFFEKPWKWTEEWERLQATGTILKPED